MRPSTLARAMRVVSSTGAEAWPIARPGRRSACRTRHHARPFLIAPSLLSTSRTRVCQQSRGGETGDLRGSVLRKRENRADVDLAKHIGVFAQGGTGSV